MEDLGDDSSNTAGLASLHHLDAAKLDDMAESLRKLECDKRGLLDEIEVLRKRLAEEKVRDTSLQDQRYRTYRNWYGSSTAAVHTAVPGTGYLRLRRVYTSTHHAY